MLCSLLLCCFIWWPCNCVFISNVILHTWKITWQQFVVIWFVCECVCARFFLFPFAFIVLIVLAYSSPLSSSLLMSFCHSEHTHFITRRGTHQLAPFWRAQPLLAPAARLLTAHKRKAPLIFCSKDGNSFFLFSFFFLILEIDMKIKMNEGAVAVSLRFFHFPFVLVMLAGRNEAPKNTM